MFYRLRAIYNPALVQRPDGPRGYFEGWYFKTVLEDLSASLAVIPGISRPTDGEPHAFVQVIRETGETSYVRYPYEEFEFARDCFDIRVGPNRFSESGMWLDLNDASVRVRGELRFTRWHPWPVTPLAPGVMGWYRFVPGMECYHGVLSLEHMAGGVIQYNDELLEFHGGRCYVEKDWGTSFPAAWVWAQANSFEDHGVSITASVAKIPWRNSYFIGHIVGFLHDGELYRFTTYTGSTLRECRVTADSAELVIEDASHRLHLRFSGATPGALASPVLGEMSGRVAETLSGRADVRLESVSGPRRTLLFEGVSPAAGLELMDDDGVLCEGIDRD